ncbi:hypothetical protein JTP68_07355 [Dietzia cinnamea]|nr:hypothetical protein [Dietzia cinnamea]
MVFDVVHDVLAQRGDGEDVAVAASTGPVPVRGADAVENLQRPSGGGVESAGEIVRVAAPVPVLDDRRLAVEIVVGRLGSARSSIAAMRSPRTSMRSRQWPAYSRGDHTRGDGRRSTPVRRRTASHRSRAEASRSLVKAGS